MRRQFEVNRVARSGRFYIINVTESGVRGAVTRQLLVHRNNMPRSDAVGGGNYTKFNGRVPIRQGFDEAGHAHIVEGSFEELADGAISGTLSIEIDLTGINKPPSTGSHHPMPPAEEAT